MPSVSPGRILVAALACALAACSTEPSRAERFCGEVAENRDALVSPAITSGDDIGPLLDLYRRIGDLAPLAIEADWDQIISAYETADTIVPGDDVSAQAALAAIYSTEKSAVAVDRWLERNCAVDIGPVFTIVEQGS